MNGPHLSASPSPSRAHGGEHRRDLGAALAASGAGLGVIAVQARTGDACTHGGSRTAQLALGPESAPTADRALWSLPSTHP